MGLYTARRCLTCVTFGSSTAFGATYGVGINCCSITIASFNTKGVGIIQLALLTILNNGFSNKSNEDYMIFISNIVDLGMAKFNSNASLSTT